MSATTTAEFGEYRCTAANKACYYLEGKRTPLCGSGAKPGGPAVYFDPSRIRYRQPVCPECVAANVARWAREGEAK